MGEQIYLHAPAETSSSSMILDPSLVLAEMARTRRPLWRSSSKSAPFRIQPLDGATARRLASASVVPWLLHLGLIAIDEHEQHTGEAYILTAEGWRVGRAKREGWALPNGGI